ncbi:hypothetical protein GCM10022262_02200 [Georgenia daeguensis]|uniref:MOSC domain-containing protein n=1 Tax=Georgenia daeguensis TaxID=908355 RepID=A0ABP8EPB7_9MICO
MEAARDVGAGVRLREAVEVNEQVPRGRPGDEDAGRGHRPDATGRTRADAPTLVGVENVDAPSALCR